MRGDHKFQRVHRVPRRVLDVLGMLCAGLQRVRVDKLQNRAWEKASLCALAFLEEVAALHQQHAKADSQQTNGNAQDTAQAACKAPDIQAVWERDWWLKKGQRRVVMRLNNVKMVPVRLDDYITDELRTCARKCLQECLTEG